MSNLVAFIVLFGVLVFVHELGHFLMAKYFKVGVEKFSLGYGPKILSKTIGGTEYLISALPLGGYVKMVGDEPVDERNAEEASEQLSEDSFLAKPPWQRILVVLMGPVANLVLPLFLVAALYMVGQPYVSSVIGFVKPGSPAATAGLKPGDEIVAIDNVDISKWKELTKLISERGNKATPLKVKRAGNIVSLNATPELGEGLNPFGEKTVTGKIGVSPQNFLARLAVPDSESPAHVAGLRSGDLLKKVGDQPIDYFWQLESAIEQSSSESISIGIERDGKLEEFAVKKSDLLIEGNIAHLPSAGIFRQELVIESIQEGSIAEEKGLKAGDILLSVNGKPLLNWIIFQDFILQNKGEEIALTVLRGTSTMAIDLSPKLVEQREALTGERYEQRRLGVASKGELRDPTRIERVLNPFKALALGFDKCYEITRLTVVGFAKLVTGKVSAKSLGGPILIYQLAGRSWQDGMNAFVHMLVLISITLGVLNLLPIPVLDGGHLMFYTIEMIRGKPVSARTRELAQQVGVLLLLSLMVFAFYNDLGRISWSEVGWLNWVKGLFS